jgi:hypothetical protein
MISFTETFIYTDQPVCCPKCGTRTIIFLDLSHTTNKIQIHNCEFENCKFEFVISI